MKKTALILTLFSLLSCSEDKELETLNKKSAREVTLSTVTKGDSVFHITKQVIWYNGEPLQQLTDTITTKLIENTWESNSTNVEKLNEIPIFVTVQ